jgi:nitroimidazol reductase NimA-like FMN-containing flavoprotein (pyridoxamine 5'-phosphate oxidase superfamily)
MIARAGAPSERVRVKRLHDRGVYDRASINAILDAMPVAHVGYNCGGAPYVTPTLQWREGNHIYWHGSAASRMLETVDEADVCVTVTLIDGFVLARSAFHHSVNYRSVMLLGRALKISDPVEKEARLQAFVGSLFPGRWDILRPVTTQELKATSVLTLPITEASAKVRCGPPKDDEDDYELNIWAGVLPIRMEILPPQADPKLKPGLAAPSHVTHFRIGDIRDGPDTLGA